MVEENVNFKLDLDRILKSGILYEGLMDAWDPFKAIKDLWIIPKLQTDSILMKRLNFK